MKRLIRPRKEPYNNQECNQESDNMAKKKTIVDIDKAEINVSPKEEVKDVVVTPKADSSNREKILDLRGKGFDDNRIAARLMISKAIVENTK